MDFRDPRTQTTTANGNRRPPSTPSRLLSESLSYFGNHSGTAFLGVDATGGTLGPSCANRACCSDLQMRAVRAVDDSSHRPVSELACVQGDGHAVSDLELVFVTRLGAGWHAKECTRV